RRVTLARATSSRAAASPRRHGSLKSSHRGGLMSFGQRPTHRITAAVGTRRAAEWQALLAVFLAACSGSTPAPAPAPVSEPTTVTSQRAPATPQGQRSRNQPLPKDARPTVAVLYFDNGAIGRAADYEPLRKGMADMLITELSRNQNLRVVERDQ